MSIQMIALKASKYKLDNYIWILKLPERVICIDPTQADVVLEYIQNNGLSIQEFWITHGHQDHVGGLSDLLSVFPKAVIKGSPLILSANQPVQDGDSFVVDHYQLEIWETLGHKRDHVIFILHLEGLHVFCGDILFSAGCGRVLDGTIKELYMSLMRINTLPADTLFYPAHEYTQHNLKFAQYVEPSNRKVLETLANIEKKPEHITLPVTLAHERQVNPFLRIHESEIIERIHQLLPKVENTPLGIFSALRSLRNQF